MSGPLEPLHPSQQRISDADRHQVAEILRHAAGDGRIDLDELDQRLEATYAAKTYADLVPITRDLPVAAPSATVARAPEVARPAVVPGPRSEHGVAIMSGYERKGSWTVPEILTVVCFMGGAELDLREARFAAREVVLNVTAIMGGAEITVNEGTRVVVEGIGIMGGYAGPSRAAEVDQDPDAPVVRVRGVALMGGVNVSRKPLPGSVRDRELPR
ncbi:MAG TPA: DUF1707 domain-containing protein [Marmoricola sp.]|nr:DUF1707 domain-containing protein [Marmoricola sp.]